MAQQHRMPDLLRLQPQGKVIGELLHADHIVPAPLQETLAWRIVEPDGVILGEQVGQTEIHP